MPVPSTSRISRLVRRTEAPMKLPTSEFMSSLVCEMVPLTGGMRDAELSEQLQIGDHIDLVLSRELHWKIGTVREHVRVERGDLLECLRAVVMKIGSGLLHAP